MTDDGKEIRNVCAMVLLIVVIVGALAIVKNRPAPTQVLPEPGEHSVLIDPSPGGDP